MSALSEIAAALYPAADRIRLRPGTPAHQKEMTASKVPAVLSLSSQESRFSLWYRMAGQVPPRPGSPETRRGHLLEDAVARYVKEEIGLARVVRGGTWRNRARPWQVASPDRLAVPPGWERWRADEVVIVESKTAADWDEWGAEGTDEIPPGYRAQVIYQLDTLGLTEAYVGVLLPRLVFRVYGIRAEEGEAEWIREQAHAFLRTLPREDSPGEPPDVDEHGQTYVALRELHPDIERGNELETPAPLAGRYVRAVLERRAAEQEYQHATNLMAEHLGDAHKALFAGATLADRRAKNGGRPYVQPATRLPDVPDLPAGEPEEREEPLPRNTIAHPYTTQEEPAP